MTGSKAFSHLRISRGCPLPFAGPPGRFQNSAEHLRFRIRLTANLFATAGFHLLQIRRINLPPCSKFLAASCRCGRPARGKSGTEIPGKSELHCTQSVRSCFFPRARLKQRRGQPGNRTNSARGFSFFAELVPAAAGTDFPVIRVRRLRLLSSMRQNAISREKSAGKKITIKRLIKSLKAAESTHGGKIRFAG